jgi:hypothetical protein
MPAYLIGSHKAAGNFGSYPHNGAVQYVTTRAWAEEIVADARYDHIVRAASAEDVAELPELPESW